LGVIWVALSLSQRLSDLLMKVPKPVVRGIQLGGEDFDLLLFLFPWIDLLITSVNSRHGLF